MSGKLEVRRWVRIGQPVYAVVQSMEGQYIAVGAEQGVKIFDLTGVELAAFPATPMPVHQLAAVPDLAQLYVGARQGQLFRLDLERTAAGFDLAARSLYLCENDLHTLALAADGQIMALGHLSSALTLLHVDGELLWRRHPQDGTATEGRMWTVALDGAGQTLYIGSADTGTNRLAALDAQSRAAHGHCYLQARVTALAPLDNGRGVAAVLAQDVYSGRLVAYDNRMATPLWECDFDEPVTALAADEQEPLLVAGVGYEGHVTLIDSCTGDVLACEPVKSVVNGLAISDGRSVAAVTQDGNLVLMHYLPEEFRL